MKEIARLTDLEIKIMKVLWAHEGITVQEIGSYLKDEGLSVPSISQAIKHLTAKNAVVIDEFVLVTSKYARTFRTCFTREEYLAAEYKRLQKFVFDTQKADLSGITAALLGNSRDGDIAVDEMDDMKRIIEEKRKQLSKGDK